MKINPKEILLLGVKRSVVAFDKKSGRELWCTELFSAMGDHFVTLLADDQYVFAHSKGELYCLNLFNGQILWKDPLKGKGYGLGSLALPGGAQGPSSFEVQQMRALEAQSSAS